jgi:hypothetical protein
MAIPPPPSIASSPAVAPAPKIEALKIETPQMEPPKPEAAGEPAAKGGGLFGVGGEAKSTQFIPPAHLQKKAPGVIGGPTPLPPGMTPEEAKKHDEAKRFARLLVSEIKLYNEAKVNAGRRDGNLYEKLKEDVDRSRQMFDERIGDQRIPVRARCQRCRGPGPTSVGTHHQQEH